ncbi:MAG: hypothetical protein N2691_04655 [Patescibacteria group bacterium]|nr:hypothetical protein [Patescibacteria group bacterium]
MADNYTDIHEWVSDSQTILSWKAPMRPYKRKGKKTMRFFLMLAFLLSVIVFFFGDPILLLPIWAVLFLFYILTITPPPAIENKITRFGVETNGILLRWELLDYFYFSQRWGFDILTIVTHAPYRLQAYLVVPESDLKRKIASILGEHIVFEPRPRRSITDKLIDLFAHLVPDDDDEPHPTRPVKAPGVQVSGA